MVVLFGVFAKSSTPALASVITASVASGTISDTDPTNVVLPTPNPPATTIFAEMVAAVAIVREPPPGLRAPGRGDDVPSAE